MRSRMLHAARQNVHDPRCCLDKQRRSRGVAWQRKVRVVVQSACGTFVDQYGSAGTPLPATCSCFHASPFCAPSARWPGRLWPSSLRSQAAASSPDMVARATNGGGG